MSLGVLGNSSLVALLLALIDGLGWKGSGNEVVCPPCECPNVAPVEVVDWPALEFRLWIFLAAQLSINFVLLSLLCWWARRPASLGVGRERRRGRGLIR